MIRSTNDVINCLESCLECAEFVRSRACCIKFISTRCLCVRAVYPSLHFDFEHMLIVM